ncbi:MAG: hypothetical protein ABI220_03865 [Candidatus Saccharimonadales bacterium]
MKYRYTKIRDNQQGIAHIILALVAVIVIGGVVGSGYVVYRTGHKTVNSDVVAKGTKTNPAPIIVSLPNKSQDIPTATQPTAPATTTNKTITPAPSPVKATPVAPSQPSPLTQYTSIPEWGVNVPLVSMTSTNIGASLVVYYRLGISDANNQPQAFFFGDSEASLSKDEGCGAGQVAGVYAFRDTTDSIESASDAAKLTPYKSVAVAGHTYNIYGMLCGGSWTSRYATLNIADHLAQMVAS